MLITVPVKTKDYHLYGGKIVEVLHVTDLGVCFDSKLSFEDHIREMIIKANKTLIMMQKHFHFSNQVNRRLLYNAFVQPIMDYASVTWSPIKKSLISAIEKVERRATHWIMMRPGMTYKERLNKCRLLSLEKRREYMDFCMMHHLKNVKINRLTNADFGIKTVKSKKNKHNIMQPWPGNRHNQREFSLPIVHGWNTLPDSIKSINDHKKFKHALYHSLQSNS